MNIAHRPNQDLKEDIRAYWSERSRTFDLAFGHKIADGPEFDAWTHAIRTELGGRPLKVLELACGTGEITRVLLSLGHEVTVLDFSAAMLSVASAKHAGNPNARFILADAENTMEPDATYDAVVCRHLVWTLTKPELAFADWYRVLKRGGTLPFFDGDWAAPTLVGRFANRLIKLLEGVIGHDPRYEGAISERHASIMRRLPFVSGLSTDQIVPLLGSAGFDAVRVSSHGRIARGQRANATLRNKLRTIIYRKVVVTCAKP